MSSYPLSTPFLVSNILNTPWTDQNIHGMDYSNYQYDSRMSEHQLQYGASSSCLYENSPPPQMPPIQPTYTTLSPQSIPMSDGSSRCELGGHSTDSGNQHTSETQLLTPKTEEGEMVEPLEKRELNNRFKREMSEPHIPLILIKGHLIRPLSNIYWFLD